MAITIKRAATVRRATELAAATGDATHDDIARLPIQLERLPFASLDARDGSQTGMSLAYPVPAGEEAAWLVAADWDGRDRDPGSPAPLPGPMANDIVVAIGRATRMPPEGMTLERLKNIDERTVNLSVTELLDLMGAPKSGHAYDTLLETCHRLGRIAITTTNAWKVDGKWVRETVTFPLFEKVRTTTRAENPAGARVEFRVSYELARAQFEHGRLLETKLYRTLAGDTARRLYRLLEVERHNEDSAGVADLRVPIAYLRDRLPILASKSVHIRRVLDRAHAELESAGYLAPAGSEGRYVDAEPEDYKRFPSYPGTRARPLAASYHVLRAPVVRTPKLADAAKAEIAAAAGIRPRRQSDLAIRMREVETLTSDRANSGLYASLCKVLPEELYQRVVATVRADKPTNPRAAFVRMAKDELHRHGIEIPAPARDSRVLAKLL